jgi:GDP-L-fucose synthase
MTVETIFPLQGKRVWVAGHSGMVGSALVRKAHDAKLAGAAQMTVWGSGTPRREFLHVDDCADALVFLMQTYSGAEHVNVGSGADQTIAEVARTVAEVVGFEGELVFDTAKPDGAPRKLISAERLAALGWRPHIGLREGLESTYAWFLARSGLGIRGAAR